MSSPLSSPPGCQSALIGVGKTSQPFPYRNANICLADCIKAHLAVDIKRGQDPTPSFPGSPASILHRARLSRKPDKTHCFVSGVSGAPEVLAVAALRPGDAAAGRQCTGMFSACEPIAVHCEQHQFHDMGSGYFRTAGHPAFHTRCLQDSSPVRVPTLMSGPRILAAQRPMTMRQFSLRVESETPSRRDDYDITVSAACAPAIYRLDVYARPSGHLDAGDISNVARHSRRRETSFSLLRSTKCSILANRP